MPKENKELDNLILNNYKNFFNVSQIAQYFDLTKDQVRHVLRKLNIEWKNFYKFKEFEKIIIQNKTSLKKYIDKLYVKNNLQLHFYKYPSRNFTIYYIALTDLLNDGFNGDFITKVVLNNKQNFNISKVKLRIQIDKNIQRFYINFAGRKIYLVKRGDNFMLRTATPNLEKITENKMMEELWG
jgi:hypothetical protein